MSVVLQIGVIVSGSNCPALIHRGKRSLRKRVIMRVVQTLLILAHLSVRDLAVEIGRRST